MHNFPKDICNKIKNEIKINSAKHVYEKYSDKIQTWFLKNNTTEKLAEYLINTIKQN
jgi:hypothetical protein